MYALQKNTILFLIEGVIYIIEYYHIFLFVMTSIIMLLYIQHAKIPTVKNKYKVFIAIFLFFFINYVFIKYL
ncbi:hypothetical protein DN393_00120 [Bacillus sp. BPN334]|nr:hypothetical protein DN393_00120 [Bacillus sp. BPN334]